MRFALLFLLTINTTSATTKQALVIGNSAYIEGYLSNPINDAKLIRDTLKELGFNVIYKKNLNKYKMEKTINSFAKSVNKNTIAVVYYAGHGMQFKEKNYLIPVGANAVKEGQIPAVSVSLDFMLGGLQDSKLSIVLLDACRNNPFKSFNRGKNRGLVRTKDNGENYIISYATAAGKVATDGKGANSPYALALAKYFRKPLPIETIFRKVRAEVKRLTGNQYPYFEPHFDEEFYFVQPDRVNDEVIQANSNTNKLQLSSSKEKKSSSNTSIESASTSHLQVYDEELLTLKVQTTPSSAKVQIMNIKPKYYDNIELAPGMYDILVSKKGYISERHSIDVNENTVFKIRLKKEVLPVEVRGKDNPYEGYKQRNITQIDDNPFRGGSHTQIEQVKDPGMERLRNFMILGK